MEVSTDSNLGAVSGNITLAGGGELLTTADGFATNRAITITDTGTLAASAGTTATYAGVISGAALTIGDTANSGTVIFSNANTFNGGLTINTGTLEVSADNNLGDASNGVTFSGGGKLLTLTRRIYDQPQYRHHRCRNPGRCHGYDGNL